MNQSEFSKSPVTEQEAFDFRKIYLHIRQYTPLIVSGIILSLIVAFMINRYTTPVYSISTSALIEDPNEMSSSVSDLLYGQELFGNQASNLENEAFLLKSYHLIYQTLDDLNFNIEYFREGNIRDLELYINSPVIMIIDDELSTNLPTGKKIICKIVDDQTYSLEFESESFITRVKAYIFGQEEEQSAVVFNGQEFTFGQPVSLGGFHFTVNYDKYKNLPYINNQVFIRISDLEVLADTYGEMLKIDPISLEASILEINIEISHKLKGIHFLDKMVQNYISDALMVKNQTADKTIDFINDQILKMSDSLSIVESRLETFKTANTGLAMSTEGSNFLEVTQRFEAEKSRLQLNNQYLTELQSVVNRGDIESLTIPSSIGITDPTLNNTIREMADMQLKIKVIGEDKVNNPLVKSYKQQLGLLKSNLKVSISGLETQNRMAISNLNERIGKLNSQIQSLPGQERQFVNIQRSYNLSETLYLFLMEKKAEAGIAEASNTIDYQIVDTARVTSHTPIKPNRGLNYIFALILGGSIPLGLIYLIKVLSNKVASKEDLISISKIPYLGMVAKNKSKASLINDESVKSEVSESFRTIRSNLRYMIGDEGAGKVFLLTSSVSTEGKSFCANNLAYVFSNFGKSVVLVNADMRKENHYENFGVTNNIGLSDYLAGMATQEEITKRTIFPNLCIIPSGGIPPNPSELLISGKIGYLIDSLKEKFDYLILDTPPIGILADGLELMEKSDVNIFVVREGFTMKEHIYEANEIYQRGKAKNMAVLLNYVDFKKTSYGYGYGYGSGGYGYYDKLNKKRKRKSKKVGVFAEKG